MCGPKEGKEGRERREEGNGLKTAEGHKEEEKTIKEQGAWKWQKEEAITEKMGMEEDSGRSEKEDGFGNGRRCDERRKNTGGSRKERA